MVHVIALSSWVAHGHVGLSAATPVLQFLGHRVTQLPTVRLSNHAGWPHVAGQRETPEMLDDLVTALDQNGWLSDIDAVLTGYLPGPEHAEFAARLIERLRGADAAPHVVVDPVLGDLPKGLYVARDAADALRAHVVPLADTITPNVFELSWLSGAHVETLANAETAARALIDQHGLRAVHVTSAPFGDGTTGILSVTSEQTQCFTTPKHTADETVPNGVGDVYSAFIAGGVGPGPALGHLRALIDASLSSPHLRIAETADIWTNADPVQPSPVPLTDTTEKG